MASSRDIVIPRERSSGRRRGDATSDRVDRRSKAIYFRKECTEKTIARDRATQWLEVGARVDINP
jgi:hypothetical protein